MTRQDQLSDAQVPATDETSPDPRSLVPGQTRSQENAVGYIPRKNGHGHQDEKNVISCPFQPATRPAIPCDVLLMNAFGITFSNLPVSLH